MFSFQTDTTDNIFCLKLHEIDLKKIKKQKACSTLIHQIHLHQKAEDLVQIMPLDQESNFKLLSSNTLVIIIKCLIFEIEHTSRTSNCKFSSIFFRLWGKGWEILGYECLEKNAIQMKNTPNHKPPEVLHSKLIYFVQQLKLVCLTLFLTLHL